MEIANSHFDGLYIGLMSGTSCDGIDAALVQINDNETTFINHYFLAFEQPLKNQIIEVSNGINDHLDNVISLDNKLAHQFSVAIKNLLKKSNRNPADIVAIGSHGQTIRHEPNKSQPYTTQIGDPNIISYETKILTVADFRRKDMAAGGQGAPLVPAFHLALFKNDKEKVILNIGGMANITHITADTTMVKQGFDTGPGNVLLDIWINHCLQKPFDEEGNFAKSGTISNALLSKLLAEPFFTLQPPKSTGRELFNFDWLIKLLDGFKLSNEDVQATLLELTAQTICNDIKKHAPNAKEIIVCGGGVKNSFLMARLQANSNIKIISSNEKGIDSDWIEAMAFAWLARQTLKNLPGNVPSVTGAKESLVLGGIYPA